VYSLPQYLLIRTMQRNARSKPKGKRSSRPESSIPGPYNIPTITLNPKRRYTLVWTSQTAGSGGYTYVNIAAQLAAQLAVNVHGQIPAASSSASPDTRFVRVVRLWAWGSPTLPMDVKNELPTGIEPPSIRFDQAAGTSDAPYCTIGFPRTTWGSVTNTTTVFSVAQAKTIHLLIETW